MNKFIQISYGTLEISVICENQNMGFWGLGTLLSLIFSSSVTYLQGSLFYFPYS